MEERKVERAVFCKWFHDLITPPFTHPSTLLLFPPLWSGMGNQWNCWASFCLISSVKFKLLPWPELLPPPPPPPQAHRHMTKKQAGHRHSYDSWFDTPLIWLLFLDVRNVCVYMCMIAYNSVCEGSWLFMRKTKTRPPAVVWSVSGCLSVYSKMRVILFESVEAESYFTAVCNIFRYPVSCFCCLLLCSHTPR